MPSASAIVLEYVCPLLGAIFANLMFMAPLKDVRQAVKKGTLGSLNPTPWAMMTGNCIGWIVYSYLIQNHFIFWANAPGLLISVWLNMAAAKLQYCDRISRDMRASIAGFLRKNRDSLVIPKGDADAEKAEDVRQMQTNQNKAEDDAPDANKPKQQHAERIRAFEHLTKTAFEIAIQKSEAQAPHEKIVVGVVAIWLTLITLISFLPLGVRQRELVVGVCVNVNISFFYGAPLSTIYSVLKAKDSSSIHKPTMILNTACALFFMLFGFGVWDYVLIVPNAVGVAMGAVQCCLRAIVPVKEEGACDAGSEEVEAAEETASHQ